MNPTHLRPAILPRLLAVLLLAAITAAAKPAPVLPGDLDTDGKVSVADHLLLQQHLRGERTLSPAQITAADMDASGSLTAADLDAIRDVLLERFPPAVVASTPANLAVLSQLDGIDLTFNKHYHDNGSVADGIGLFEAGPDRHLGTADDVSIPGSVTAAPPALGFDLTAPAGLGLANGPGTYGLRAGPPIADFQGRAMLPFAEKFLVPGDDPLRDSDFDGIPDLDEIANGTNPLLVDSDGDLADDWLERQLGSDPNDPASIPGESGNTVSVMSATVSYANLAIESGTLPSGWISVFSPVVSYANLPVESGTLPPTWVSVFSPVVSYANLPVESGTLPPTWVSVFSPVVSYANLPVETVDPVLTNTVTVVSAMISYQNDS